MPDQKPRSRHVHPHRIHDQDRQSKDNSEDVFIVQDLRIVEPSTVQIMRGRELLQPAAVVIAVMGIKILQCCLPQLRIVFGNILQDASDLDGILLLTFFQFFLDLGDHQHVVSHFYHIVRRVYLRRHFGDLRRVYCIAEQPRKMVKRHLTFQIQIGMETAQKAQKDAH